MTRTQSAAKLVHGTTNTQKNTNTDISLQIGRDQTPKVQYKQSNEQHTNTKYDNNLSPPFIHIEGIRNSDPNQWILFFIDTHFQIQRTKIKDKKQNTVIFIQNSDDIIRRNRQYLFTLNCQYNPFPIDIIPFGNEQWDTKYTLFIISKFNHFPFSLSIETQSTSIMGHKS